MANDTHQAALAGVIVVKVIFSRRLVTGRWDSNQRVKGSEQVLRLVTLWLCLQKEMDVGSRWLWGESIQILDTTNPVH
jgi:hypothetical protein